jgi:hypothetical protein
MPGIIKVLRPTMSLTDRTKSKKVMYQLGPLFDSIRCGFLLTRLFRDKVRLDR